jgi:hypothetical protein
MTERYIQYKLNLAPDLYQQARELAQSEGRTFASLLRRGINWTILLHKIQKNGGRVLISQEAGAQPTEVLMLWGGLDSHTPTL